MLKEIPKEAGRPKKIIDNVVDNLSKETKSKVTALSLLKQSKKKPKSLSDNVVTSPQ